MPTIIDTLDPSGPTEKDVDISVCHYCYDYFGTLIDTDCVQIPVTIKNPCIDLNYVSIDCPASLDSLTYIVSSGK